MQVLGVLRDQESVYKLRAASSVWADLLQREVFYWATYLAVELFSKVCEVVLAEDGVLSGHLQSDGAQVFDSADFAEVLGSLEPLADICFGDVWVSLVA